MRPVFRFACAVSVVASVLLVSAAALFAQGKGPRTVKRAQPPKFDNAVKDTFFADAFKEALVGERPADLNKAVASSGPKVGPGPATPAGDGGGASSGTGWSSLISSSTIEDEIKALRKNVDAGVTTPSDFAGKGYKAARRDFSMLAMLFAIIGDYDGDVRFKKSAPAARDVFARTAANAKVGTSQVFNEAKIRKQELGDLLNGSDPFGGKEAEKKPTWTQVCDRSPLMQHLEAIFEPRLKQNLSDKGRFTNNAEEVVRDAEVIAAIGQVMMAEGMEDADADDYKQFCAKLVKAGKDITEAVKLKNFDAASAAAAAIGKSCTECHEAYRSS